MSPRNDIKYSKLEEDGIEYLGPYEHIPKANDIEYRGEGLGDILDISTLERVDFFRKGDGDDKWLKFTDMDSNKTSFSPIVDKLLAKIVFTNKEKNLEGVTFKIYEKDYISIDDIKTEDLIWSLTISDGTNTNLEKYSENGRMWQYNAISDNITFNFNKKYAFTINLFGNKEADDSVFSLYLK